MPAKIWAAAAFALVSLVPAIAQAAAPSFVVYCMRTAGPATGEKYGTYYFFLRDGIVKGYACKEPGRPCQIVSQDNQQVVFQTPGEAPDTLIINLRTGAIEQKRTDGLQWSFTCKQIPYQQP